MFWNSFKTQTVFVMGLWACPPLAFVCRMLLVIRFHWNSSGMSSEVAEKTNFRKHIMQSVMWNQSRSSLSSGNGFVLYYPSSRALPMCAGNYTIKCSSMEIWCEDYRTYVFSVHCSAAGTEVLWRFHRKGFGTPMPEMRKSEPSAEAQQQRLFSPYTTPYTWQWLLKPLFSRFPRALCSKLPSWTRAIVLFQLRSLFS